MIQIIQLANLLIPSNSSLTLRYQNRSRILNILLHMIQNRLDRPPPIPNDTFTRHLQFKFFRILDDYDHAICAALVCYLEGFLLVLAVLDALF